MLLSMTGFATKTAVLPVAEGEETQLIVEIKSLNSRYFESTCKLPSSLNFLEMSIINTLKEKLVRGRVFVLVKLSTEGGSFERVIPVMKVVKDYLAAAETIKKTGNVQGELALSNILTLPNVFASEREELGADTEKAILKIVGEVIDKLVEVRTAEGLRLEKDLKKRFDVCTKHIDSIKKLFDAIDVFCTNIKSFFQVFFKT